jgi:hypothetical protein
LRSCVHANPQQESQECVRRGISVTCDRAFINSRKEITHLCPARRCRQRGQPPAKQQTTNDNSNPTQHAHTVKTKKKRRRVNRRVNPPLARQSITIVNHDSQSRSSRTKAATPTPTLIIESLCMHLPRHGDSITTPTPTGPATERCVRAGMPPPPAQAPARNGSAQLGHDVVADRPHFLGCGQPTTDTRRTRRVRQAEGLAVS